MPVNAEETYKTWVRYAYVRDNGHTKFMEKAAKCERFFAGDQWDPVDKAKLAAVKRPALTINKIISTVSNVMGEQIYNRAETSYRPRNQATDDSATIMTKVFKQISDNNQLAWKRSDMFADGIITSRGYLDMRLTTRDSMQGEVQITKLNPKNVLPDPDAEDYDPDTWGEVFTTTWLTTDDVAVLYNKEDAELLRNRDNSAFPYGYDSIQLNRDRFGELLNPLYAGGYDQSNVLRNVRLIERQYRTLDKQKHFLSPETGDMRPIPEDFDRNRIAYFVEKFGFQVVPKLVRRIKWLAMADNVLLHHDWSPYKHFTVIPYFPYFRHGKTIGLVENLIDSQDLLNKVTSQELHVVNTTANSGYKVKAGALVNMTVAELEQRGAETGIVLEVNGDPDKDVQKIQPNQVPQGLDRVSYKAEEHIKTISGVSDSMQGFDREDVAAKAIQEKKKSGSTNLVKPMDSLTRTDFIIARNALDLVQEFYTEARMIAITGDEATGETEQIAVNQVDQYGQIVNDLTLGEYGVVVTSVPARETLEDSQFEQAMAMREAGIQIPDSVLIDSSRLMNKKDIIKQMEGDQTSPEAQQQKALMLRGQSAEVLKLEGEAASKHADAQLKMTKAQEAGQGDAGKLREVEMTAALKERELEHDMSIKERELAMDREVKGAELQLKAQDLAQKREDAKIAAAQQAAKEAQKPQGPQK